MQRRRATGSNARPSSSSVTCAPSAVSSAASAASRSVSWPRRCPMPVMRPGDAARAASAANVGASSPPCERSRSTPGIATPPSRPAPPSTVSMRAVRRPACGHRRAVAGEQVGRASSPTCVVASGQPLDRDRAAGDQGRREERRGVREVGLDRDAPRRRSGRAGRPTRPARGCSTVDAACGEARRSSSRCAACSAAARPRAAASARARSAAPRAAGPRRTGSRRTRRSSTSPPSTRAGAVDRERQRAAAVVVDVDAEGAQRLDRRAHRAGAGVLVAVDGDRAEREGRDRRDEAHHGAGETGSRSRCRRCSSPGSMIQSGPNVAVATARSMRRAQRAQRLGHQGGVARVQRPVQRRRPSASAESTSSRLVRLFDPGRRQPGVERRRMRRAPPTGPARRAAPGSRSPRMSAPRSE